MRTSDSDSIGLTSQHMVAPRNRPAHEWENDYECLGTLPSGGQADVFKARKRTGDKRVAIKQPNALADSQERFPDEVTALQACQHRHVMPVLDRGTGWYAMPLAVGTLRDLAPELSEEERLNVVDHVAQGLAHAHSTNRFHRDVSPANILQIDDEYGLRWVIGDFGLHRRPPGQTSSPRTAQMVGTRGFEAPEMEIMGAHHVDRRADIYSLGMTVAFMVTGAMSKELPDVEIPMAWSSIITKMTMRAVAERLQSMEDVRQELEGVRTAIKQQRRTNWKLPARVLAVKPYELAVLAAILEHGDYDVGHSNREDGIGFPALQGVPGLEARTLKLGLISLRERGFIGDAEDDRGTIRGYTLTDNGRAWLLANDTLVLSAPSTVSHTPSGEIAGGAVDDIPY